MSMGARGLAKLLEEIGELQKELGELAQVIGKRLGLKDGTNEHWDGTDLRARLEDEIADVLASANFVCERWGLNLDRIHQRTREKTRRYREWDQNPDNNGPEAGDWVSF